MSLGPGTHENLKVGYCRRRWYPVVRIGFQPFRPDLLIPRVLAG
jgi:hypothetical protein